MLNRTGDDDIVANNTTAPTLPTTTGDTAASFEVWWAICTVAGVVVLLLMCTFIAKRLLCLSSYGVGGGNNNKHHSDGLGSMNTLSHMERKDHQGGHCAILLLEEPLTICELQVQTTTTSAATELDIPSSGTAAPVSTPTGALDGEENLADYL